MIIQVMLLMKPRQYVTARLLSKRYGKNKTLHFENALLKLVLCGYVSIASGHKVLKFKPTPAFDRYLNNGSVGIIHFLTLGSNYVSPRLEALEKIRQINNLKNEMA